MNVRRIALIAWIASWFELYLEIFRHHHVTMALLVHPRAWFAATDPTPATSHPGGWLQTVLVCSVVAPLLVLAMSIRARTKSWDSQIDQPFPFAPVLIAAGAALVMLAAINQLVRHDATTIDLTLRTGNTGFMILGAALVAVGVLLRRSRKAFR